MSVRPSIIDEIVQVAEQQGRRLAPLHDDLRLLDSGLDSLCGTSCGSLSVYSTTKAGLEGFTRLLAREVGPFGITVNAVAPGFLDTEMTHGLDLSDRERIAGAARCSVLPRSMTWPGRLPVQRKGSQHHRHGAFGRCRQHRLARTATDLEGLESR